MNLAPTGTVESANETAFTLKFAKIAKNVKSEAAEDFTIETGELLKCSCCEELKIIIKKQEQELNKQQIEICFNQN